MLRRSVLFDDGWVTLPAKLKVTVLVAIVLVVAGYFALTRALDRMVKNGTLVRLIARRTAVRLGADSGYLPLDWRGMSIRSDGFLARGKPPRALQELSATDLRAQCSLQNLWQRKWTITLLDTARMQAAFGQAAGMKLQRILPRDPELQPQIDTPSPLKIDIHEVRSPRTDLYWGETPQSVGGLTDVESRFYPKDHGLDIFGRGGVLHQTGWPDASVDELHFNWTKPKLVVQTALLSLGQPKNLTITGDFDFGDPGRMNLHLSSKATPAEPFIAGYWRGKFEGVVNFETDLHKQFHPDTKLTATGQLSFTRATIHDVATLKQVAAVTRHPQFEKPKIDSLSFRYRWTGTRLEVSEFEIETKGLCRLEGEFSMENQNIDGRFKVGAAPDVVETIPGAREKVFTESRGGYSWTSLRLSGPAQHPREDLKQRLVAAAEEHFARGLLAPILKPGKELLEMLRAIYK